MSAQPRVIQGVTVAAFGGLALVAIGSFGPWVTAPLSSASGLDGDGKWTIILAAGAAWLIYSRTPARALLPAGLACAAILVFGIYDAVHIHRAVARVTFNGTQIDHVGWGVDAVIAGAVLTIAALWRARA